MAETNVFENKMIIKARVTLVFAGYGILTLTDTALMWEKTASSFVAFGAANTLTENRLIIPLYNIVDVEKYTYFPGGGLVITLNTAQKRKIAFKRKKDFEVVYGYLKNYLGNK